MPSAVAIIDDLNASTLKTDLPTIDVGDTINVHGRIVEGDKERIQIFQGVVIAKAGRGINAMITVRRIVDEMGVERMFPLHSPRVARFEVVRKADARRAKLYYLRDRVGKSRRLRDKRRGLNKPEAPATTAGA
jgi:large subunit ribosomal protein L19